MEPSKKQIMEPRSADCEKRLTTLYIPEMGVAYLTSAGKEFVLKKVNHPRDRDRVRNSFNECGKIVFSPSANPFIRPPLLKIAKHRRRR